MTADSRAYGPESPRRWVKKMKTICFIILLLPLIGEGAPEHLREQRAIEDLGASRMYGDWVDVESGAKGGNAEEPLKSGQRIVELSLNSHRKLRDEQLKALESLPHLIYLGLDHTNVSDEGASHVQFCTKLRKLTFREVPITDVSVEVLSDLIALRELDLWGTKISDKGVKRLAELPKLESLILHDTSVTDEGIASFFGKSSLQEIGLGNTKVTAVAKKRLRETIPGIKIWPDDSALETANGTQHDVGLKGLQP